MIKIRIAGSSLLCCCSCLTPIWYAAAVLCMRYVCSTVYCKHVLTRYLPGQLEIKELLLIDM